MKASYQLENDLYVELEFNTTQELVDCMTVLREVQTEPCGDKNCGNTNTFARARKNGDNVFYGIECPKCGRVLELGTRKDGPDKGSLYKKRLESDGKGKAVKDANGKCKYLPNKGWLKYNPTTNQME